jgi:hypothetical protein
MGCRQSTDKNKGAITTPYASEEEQYAAKALYIKEIEAAKQNYTACMDEKNKADAPGSWPGSEFPSVHEDKPFGGGADAEVALSLAETHGFLAPILCARNAVVASIFTMQCIVCMACGDSRTTTPLDPKDMTIEAVEESWFAWESASENSSFGGAELSTLVLDGIRNLQQGVGLKNLLTLVGLATEAVFTAIPDQHEGESGTFAWANTPIQDVNTRPVQSISFLITEEMHRKAESKVPLADWTPEMRSEVEAAIKNLNTGEFGDPSGFEVGGSGRLDFIGVYNAPNEKEIKRAEGIDGYMYLLALGINRFQMFHALGAKVAAAVGGGAEYQPGPLKSRDRMYAKCGPGGDYHSNMFVDMPNCKRVLDVLRGSVMCTSHAMIERAYASAVEIFGEEPAVVKDRRRKVQHDILLVFKVEGMYVELQLHYKDTIAIKVLAHAVFELQRLSTDKVVSVSGLKTIFEYPKFAKGSAADVKVLLHI